MPTLTPTISAMEEYSGDIHDDWLRRAAQALAQEETPTGTSEEWRRARRDYLALHAEWVRADIHPSVAAFHAGWMALVAAKMADESPEHLFYFCDTLAVAANAEQEHREFAAGSAEDLDLVVPTTYPQRPDATYDDFEQREYASTSEEIAAMATVIAQDVIAAKEHERWRASRDDFLRYLTGYSTPDLHPVQARYYAWRMSHHAFVMRHGTRGPDWFFSRLGGVVVRMMDIAQREESAIPSPPSIAKDNGEELGSFSTS